MSFSGITRFSHFDNTPLERDLFNHRDVCLTICLKNDH